MWMRGDVFLPFPNVLSNPLPIPLVWGSKHSQTSRSKTLPQLAQPALWLRQPVQKLKQNEIKVFYLIRDPCQLCMARRRECGWVRVSWWVCVCVVCMRACMCVCVCVCGCNSREISKSSKRGWSLCGTLITCLKTTRPGSTPSKSVALATFLGVPYSRDSPCCSFIPASMKRPP